MAEFSGEDVLRAELREQLENYVYTNWETEWEVAFGEFEPARLNRGSKFIETLAEKISRTSGIEIKRDTLNRFIKKSVSTQEHSLTAICRLLEYSSWKDFKTQNMDSESIRGDVEFLTPLLNARPTVMVSYGIFAIGFVLTAVLSFVYYFYQTSSQPTGKPTFTLLHKSGENTPATYFLSVDLTGFDYDSAYVTFNHRAEGKNLAGDQQKIVIQKTVDTLTYVAYKPDVIFAQLIVNGEVMSVIRLITYSDDWVAWYNAFLPETNTEWVDPLALPKWYRQQGKLHFRRENIQNHKHRGYYYTEFSIVKEFGIDLSKSDIAINFRNNQENGGISCFEMASTLYDNQGNELRLVFNRIGCSYNYLRFNQEKIAVDIKAWDKLTFDATDWSKLTYKINGKTVDLFLQDELLIQLKIPKVMSELAGIKIGFKGSGELNVVDIKDAKGAVYYEDFGEVLTDKMAEIN